MKTLCRFLIVVLCACRCGHAAPVMFDFAPRAGTPGTVITVTGTGFGSNAGEVSAMVGETPATLVSVAPEELKLNAPAATGFVSVTVSGAVARSVLPFSARRTVSGAFVPPAGMNAAGYRTGQVSQATAGAAFTAQVALQKVDAVWAWREGTDPMFGALVMPGQATVQIDAASTALLLLTLSPLAPKGDPVTVNEMLARAAGSAELTALTSIIAAAGTGGYQYSRDGRFSQAYRNLMTKALTSPAGLRLPRNFVPPGRGYVDQLEPEDAIAPQRLKNSLTQLSADPPVQLLTSEFSPSNPTRLQQNLELWRVDPKWFTAGFSDVLQLSITDRPPLLDASPYAIGFVPAKLGSANLDPGEWIGKGVTFLLENIPDTASTDALFKLPRHRPGVYMLNAYSGNIWFGTQGIDPGRSQAALLSQIDVNSNWRAAMVANFMTAAVDMASVLLPEIEVLGRKELGELVKVVAADVDKAVTSYIAAYGKIDVNGAVQIAMATAVALVKGASAALTVAAMEAEYEHWSAGILNIAGAVFDAFGKVSSGLQAAERGGALVTPTHYAVERTVIVIGDPFAPRITSFSPATARGGDVITLSGENLTFDTTGYKVHFMTFEATGSPPDVSKRLQATITYSNLGTWAVKLPTAAQWETVFGPGNKQVFIGVQNTGSGGETSTAENPAPNNLFHYRTLPQLTAALPSTLPSGSVLMLDGADFDFPVDLGASVEVDGVPGGGPIAVTPTRVYVQLDSQLINGQHSIRLIYRDGGQVVGATNALNFTIANPYPPFNNNVPRRLRVMSRAFTNVPDGTLNLYEAMALATGSLGRGLTVRPEGQTMGAYESDWVEFPGGGGAFYGSGAAIRDEVYIDSGATGSLTINVTPDLPIPLPGTGDSLSLPGIIFDGGATLPGTIGWDLRGVSGNTLDGSVTFRNFPDDGIVIGNGAQLNRISNPRVEDCGGSGIVLAGGATDNYIYIPQVTGADGHGVHLSGAGVTRNYLASDTAIPLSGIPGVMRVKDSGATGVLLEGGAHGNQIDVWEVRGNQGDGIRLTGAGTNSNMIGGAYFPGKRDVAGNTGHGVALLDGASGNTLWNVCAGGNGGDGFHLGGATTTRNNLRAIATGFDFAAKGTAGFVARNTGYSVQILNSSFNLLGTRVKGQLFNTPFSGFGGGTAGATLLITGPDAHHNVVDAADFGFIDPLDAPPGTAADLLLVPAATHAIHITGGAHDNVIGNDDRGAAVSVLAAPNGAGVRIEGAGTDNNRVFGVTFGYLRTDLAVNGQQVRVGVHVLNGAKGNRIGEVGNQRFEGSRLASQPYNAYGSILEAGVRLENVNSDFDAAGNPVGANMVINSRMGTSVFGGVGTSYHPEVGIHLKGLVTGQWIGGLTRAEGNQMSRYGFAGLWIENGAIPSPEYRNRITATVTTVGVGSTSVTSTDPFAGPVIAQGLLITGGSGVVVGEDWPLYNQFNGSRLGAYLEGGTGHWIRSAWFDSGTRGGVFIHNGAKHLIGSTEKGFEVQVTRNGTVSDGETAGIVIAGGSLNRIEGCKIGTRGTADTIWGARGHGVLVHESAGNWIGGSGHGAGNEITRSTLNGITIRGVVSQGNRVGHNKIIANGGDGILISGGAGGTFIGGPQIPGGAPPNALAMFARNRIFSNGGDGVHVDGATTVANRILANEIFSNGTMGIRLSNNGNHFQPPPAQVYIIERKTVAGAVASLAETPAGSRVEAYMNGRLIPDPEGETYLGRGFVQADGTFSFTPPVMFFGGKLTVTVTNSLTGDTSEFKTETAPPPEGFGFSLSVPQGESSLTKPWPAAGAFSAAVLTAATEGARVELKTLKVSASGTGDFAAALAGVSLFEDVDRDGFFSAPDHELAPVTAFTAGEAELQPADAFVDDSGERRWILRLHPVAGVSPAGNVRLQITNDAAVGEFYWQPVEGSGTTAVFPLQSALFQAGAVDPRAGWRASYGLPADGSGDGADSADPDRDGFANLLEYALGSSPVDGKDAARPAAARTGGPDRITLSYQKLRSDVTYTVEAAVSLTGPWSSAGVDQGGAGPPVTASVPVAGGRRFLRLRVQ